LKWKISLIILCLGLSGFFGFKSLKKHTLVSTSGNLTLSILDDSVEVYRDKNGVPHIEARNEDDLMRAFGFIFASDKLGAMVEWRDRYLGTRSVSEGKESLDFDKISRSLGLYHYIPNYWKKLKQRGSIDIVSSIENFVSGVNSFILSGPLPLEFYISGSRPKLFTSSDVLGVLTEYSLSGAIDDFVHVAKLEKFKATLPKTWQKYATPWSNKVANVQKWDTLLLEKKSYPRKSFSLLIGGEKLLNKKPLMAFHSWNLPGKSSLYYEAHLKSPRKDVYGYYLPLVPFPIAGFDSGSTWSFTPTHVNEINFVVAKEDALIENWESFELQDNLSYSGRWHTKFSDQGPVLPFRSASKGQKVWWQMQWPYLKKPEAFLFSLYHASSGSNLQEKSRYFEKEINHGIHFHYADSAGQIARLSSIFNGKGKNGFRLLRKENPIDGLLVSFGTQEESESNLAGNYTENLRREDIIKELQDLNGLDQQNALNLALFKNRPQVRELGRKMMLFLDKELLFSSESNKKIFSELNSWNGNLDLLERPSKFLSVWAEQFSGLVESQFSIGEMGEDPSSSVSWFFIKKLLLSDNLLKSNIDGLNLKNKIKDLVTLSFKSAMREKSRNEVLPSNLISKFRSQLLEKWNDNIFTVFEEGLHSWGKMPFEGMASDKKAALITALRFVWQPGEFGMSHSLIPGGNSGAWGNPHFFDQLPLFFKDGWQQSIKYHTDYSSANMLQLHPLAPSY
jgi:acyl-homoserine lactone acylase PvdQ